MTRASDLSELSCTTFCRYHLSEVGGIRGKNRQSSSCVVDTHGEVELLVIGVLVVVVGNEWSVMMSPTWLQ